MGIEYVADAREYFVLGMKPFNRFTVLCSCKSSFAAHAMIIEYRKKHPEFSLFFITKTDVVVDTESISMKVSENAEQTPNDMQSNT